MTIHENQLVLLTEAEIAEIAAKVVQTDEIRPVYDLAVQRDQYKAENDTATRLYAQERALKIELIDLRDRRDATQKVHDTLSEKVRMSEDQGCEQVLKTPGIEELRAIHGARTSKVVRESVVAHLKANFPGYQEWLKSMGELQSEIDTFPGRIEKLERRVRKAGENAKAQSLKAGEILLAVRTLEAVLRGEKSVQPEGESLGIEIGSVSIVLTEEVTL
jgi:hypothetical protein